MLGGMGQMPPLQAYPRGKEMAQKALQLDNELPESHVAIALIKLFYDWDLEGAEQALELDPLSLIINQHYAQGLVWLGKFKESLIQLNKTLEMDPNFRPAIENKGWVYIEMGDYENAINTFKHFQELTGHPLKGITGLGYAYAINGNIDEAKQCLNKLAQREKIEPEVMLHTDYVVIYTALNDLDKLFYHLEEALKQKSGVYFTKTAPIFKEIRKNPRYNQLMKKYGYSSS